MMNSDINIGLLVIIALLMLTLIYLNKRINSVEWKLDVLGGIVFSLLEAMTISNKVDRDLINLIKSIIDDQSSDLDELAESAKDVDTMSDMLKKYHFSKVEE